MMTYTTRQPRTLTATETRLLRTIAAAGWWSVDPKCIDYEQQETLEFLWRHGYIERKAYGGWGVKAQPVTPATDAAAITALLATAGVDVARIKCVMPTTDAYARPGSGQQWTVIMRDSLGLMGVSVEAFAVVEVVNDRKIMLRLKGE